MSKAKSALLSVGRSIIVAVVTTALIVTGLLVVFNGQTQQRDATENRIREASELTVKLNSAIGCELGVPTIVKDGATFRDPDLLRSCWTNEGLKPPVFLHDSR